ncbi:MAG: SRPBCC family protein [Pseudomonadota bacterium]
MRAWVAAVLMMPLPVTAAELLSIDVEHEDGVYTMTSETRFDAPIIGVFDVLTDYEQFDRISSIYRDSGYVDAAEDGTPRVFTEVRGCVMFFCQTMRRTERLENDGLVSIRTVLEPEGSDFVFSEAAWSLREDNEATIVIYTIRMQPAFWVPPVIGPYMMKRKLAKGGADAIERIEALARQSTTRPADLKARGLAGFEDG